MSRLEGKLSLIMPAYNEGTRIYQNIMETGLTVSEMAIEYEVIVVNDGSTDNTLEEAQKAIEVNGRVIVLNQQPNQGKGQALRLGTQIASGDYIAFCDADLDLHPSQLNNFINIMNEDNADAVIGSKMHPDSADNYPFSRKIISWGYYILLRILFQLKIRDTQTGLKLFKAKAIKPAMRQILVKRFAYDIEVLALLNQRKFRLTQAPVRLVFQRGVLGSRIRLKDIIHVAWDTIAIFYRLKILHYYDKFERMDLARAMEVREIHTIGESPLH